MIVKEMPLISFYVFYNFKSLSQIGVMTLIRLVIKILGFLLYLIIVNKKRLSE